MENIKKPMELNDFVYLMLATLADDSKRINLKDRNQKTASLPVQYKQIIANILCADNGWKEKFSVLIDVEEYFDDHFYWEMNLVSIIKQTLITLRKTIEYDLDCDSLLITFTQDEIDMIMNLYPDEELKNTMQHFTNLLVSYIYTREFQENFHDYSADTIKKMHDMKIDKTVYKSIKSDVSQSKNKILGLLKKEFTGKIGTK